MSTSWLHTFTGNLTVTFPNETKSETLSPATVDANNNVEWKLGDHKLRDGYTYTVKFPVWPSQDAYDALFKVAEVVADNGYRLKVDDRFASVGEIPATSEELDIVNMDLAEAMEKIAKDYDFDVPSQETDANGQVSFDGLEAGLYLVMQDARGEGENRFFLSPFLISIPYRNADGSLAYDITADAKPIGVYKEQVPPPPAPTPKKIPQTGQLWWPVAMLGAAGVLFVVMGMVRRSKSN